MAPAALILAMACGGGGGGGGNTLTNVAPQITTQPASQTVNAGSAASFTVAASGTPAPTFTWQRSNDGGTTWTAISGATSATYTFTAAKADHTAQFRATAGNTVSPDATSTAATLSVQWLAITTQPGNKSAVEGSPATFTIVPDANPAASLQWQSSADGTTWTNVAGATTASYTTGATSLSSSGTKFRCVLTNATGSINSNAATLTVTALVIAPAITTQPISATVTAGSPASFTVVATGTAPLHYQWKKGTTNVGTDAATYTIPSTTAGDAGSYTVAVSNTASSVTSTAATLIVNLPPAITTQPISATVTAGSAASFTVVATGTALHYQWKQGPTNVGTDSATYSIAAAAAGDAGSYTVTVSNAYGSSVTSSAATLTVNLPPAITTQPISATVTAGSAASFTVVATGTALHYQWKQGPTNVGTDSATYSIAAAAAGDAGSYTVTVSNAYGSSVTSSAATLTVNLPPAITTQPISATVTAGSAASFTVVATGTALHYQWKQGPTNVGTDSATYSIAAAAAGDAGSYTVTVSNAYGSSVTSSAATLTVNLPPAITTQPISATVTTGSPASFTVVATGTAPLHYQWKKDAANVGTDSATYSIAAAAAGDAGSYTVTVSNGFGSPVISSAATLTVIDAPVITSFIAAKSTVTIGTGTTLTAVFTGGVTATVDNGIGSVVSGVAVPTGNLMANTTFTLTVTNAAGTPVTQSVTVNVVATPTQPVVTAPANVTASQAGYTASIVSQAGSTYNWSLSGGTFTGQGTTSIVWTAPASGTVTLTCTVTNAAGDSALPGTATSTVVPAPSIASFTNGGLLADGTGTTLQATFAGGTGLVTPGDLAITSGTGLPLAGALTSNTIYTLTVTNPAGTSVRAATTVAVLPVFTTNPAPQVLVPAGTATFTVAVSSAAPILSIDWKRSDDGGVNWTTALPPPPALSLSYTTGTLAASDNGALFRAVAWNVNGSTTSMAAGLNQALNVVAGTTSIDLVKVPAGTFTMGETDTAPAIVGSEPSTLPAHAVTFAKAFYMAKVPCTQAQWLAIMGANPSSFTLDDAVLNDHLTRPVEMVSFDDITAPSTGFLALLNAATASDPIRVAGGFFRLPTEAEFEYACRAGSTGQNNYYFGSYDSGSTDSAVLALIDTYLWSSRNSASLVYPLGSTRPVGMKLPNAWGLYDMAGNVWQVCEDDWHDSYAATGTGVPLLPTDGTAWVDSPRAILRAFRAGSWQHNSHYGQSKSRGKDPHDTRDFTLGFRVVLQLP